MLHQGHVRGSAVGCVLVCVGLPGRRASINTRQWVWLCSVACAYCTPGCVVVSQGKKPQNNPPAGRWTTWVFPSLFPFLLHFTSLTVVRVYMTAWPSHRSSVTVRRWRRMYVVQLLFLLTTLLHWWGIIYFCLYETSCSCTRGQTGLCPTTRWLISCFTILYSLVCGSRERCKVINTGLFHVIFLFVGGSGSCASLSCDMCRQSQCFLLVVSPHDWSCLSALQWLMSVHCLW